MIVSDIIIENYHLEDIMQDMNLILKIQSVYNQFTKAEKKVADYCLEHKEEVPFMSITDLADACKVGDTSVYRFCRTGI